MPQFAHHYFLLRFEVCIDEKATKYGLIYDFKVRESYKPNLGTVP